MSEQGSTRLIIPGLAGLYDAGSAIAYPVIRLVAGLFLIPHGYQKFFEYGVEAVGANFAKMGIEPGVLMATLAALVELVGGALVAIGLLTRPAAAACAVLLAVATFGVHFKNGFFAGSGGFEFAMMWMILMIVIFFRGGGAYSVDRAIGREF